MSGPSIMPMYSTKPVTTLAATRSPGVWVIAVPSSWAGTIVANVGDGGGPFGAVLVKDGELLAVRCAIGAAHVAVLATLSTRARAGEPAELTEDEVERVIRAALAAWGAAT